MHKLANRLDHFSDSVIRRMTRIANQYQAINLSQGLPMKFMSIWFMHYINIFI